jgi:hypothetical protein
MLINRVITNTADLQHKVHEFKRNSETPVQGAEADFGQRVKEAVTRRLSGHRGIAASATEESFGAKLSKATEEALARRHGTREQQAARAERERARYHKPVRRARTKGE